MESPISISIAKSKNEALLALENLEKLHQKHWLAKGKKGAENHIKNAYVTKAVATNKKSRSKKVTLKKGTYEYFCPLNPTPRYSLVVQ